MKFYRRKEVEESLITHAKVGGNKVALTLQDEVFQGVPGHYIGVEEFSDTSLGVVFFAEATHPDETIPHFRNLDEGVSKTLHGNLIFLPHRNAECRVARAVLDWLLETSGYPQIAASLPAQVEYAYIIPTAGIVGCSHERIVTKLCNPKIAEEVYQQWQKIKKPE